MDWSALDNSPPAIREFLAAEGLAPKKRWGQNYMVSPGARDSVIALSGLRPGEGAWEIGPGLGAITSRIVTVAGEVTLFEIDHGMIRVLRSRFGDRVRIVPGDAVASLASELAEGSQRPDCIIGNLPYRSAASIIAVLLESDRVPGECRRMVFTVQREMARRMLALPGQKDYSPFTVLCTLAGTVRHGGDLAGGSFYPPPGVVSSLVSIEPSGVDRTSIRLASVCARSLFVSRRKTIRNNLPGLITTLALPRAAVEERIEECGIRLSARAETVEPEAFLELASSLRLDLSPDYSG